MKKKKLIIIIPILVVSITLIGLSFGYFIANINTLNKDNSNSSISSGSIVEAILEIPNKSDNTNIYPGYKTSKEYIVKGKGNSNSISTEASLIVKPNLGDYSKYVYWSLYKSDEEITCTNSLDSSGLGFSYKSECNIPASAKLVLSGNEDTTHINITVNYDTNDKYYLVTEYLDNDENQSGLMGKSFNVDVSLEKPEDSIQNKIISQLDTTGKCPTVNEDGSVNVTSAESENSLLCSAPDNYGTSYYYRGNVQNNYVRFAGFYWRIVRINGDGSIRMIYDGTSAHQNGEASEDRQIGTSAFNEKYNDNAYVGYMYGTPGSSTYEETHANINDSTIKKYIDTWYENNIKDTDYEKYLADNIFCNDRTLSNENLNVGYGFLITEYRWYHTPWITNPYNSSSNLKCLNKNDSFSSNSSALGNHALKYPIGLISVDEINLAGGTNVENTKYYLYTGNWYYTMTPYYYNGTSAMILYMYSNGAVNGAENVNDGGSVKPVINLKPNSLKSGSGTMDNPYTIE